jgi:hypothetical protein
MPVLELSNRWERKIATRGSQNGWEVGQAMKRIFLIFLFVIPSLWIVKESRAERGETDRAEGAKQLVLQVEDQMNQAILQKDTAVLARIYADRMIYINGTGKVFNKSQALADYKSGNNTLLQLNHHDIRLQSYGNTIVLTGRSDSAVRYEGEVIEIPRQFTNVFLLLDGRWQIISHQVTNIEKTSNPGRQ